MRRLLIIAMVAVLAGCVMTHPKLNPAKPAEYTVTVYSDRAWQDSGVHVRRGQIIQCKAEGQWSDRFASYGPEGNPDLYNTHFGVKAPANSLIMRINTLTNTYFIGKQTNIVAKRSGEIRFRKNYSLPIGMAGAIKVKVKVCADADGDGISDYDEIHVWKTNPLSPDSDGDGFIDLEEVAGIKKEKDSSR